MSEKLRVLLVDLDPQGNASTGLGIRHESRYVTVYDVLAAEAPIDFGWLLCCRLRTDDPPL